jgi:hypothetical protein
MHTLRVGLKRRVRTGDRGKGVRIALTGYIYG